MPPGRSNPRLSFRSSLDRDVYQIVKRFEEAEQRPASFKSVSAAYEAIKRSNSSLARLKKRPLEDAIDRVLQIRKQEKKHDDESDDSEAAIDEPEPAAKAEDERFLLNRQMTKLWNVENGTPSSGEQPATKKRRINTDTEDKDEQTEGAEAGEGTALTIDKRDKPRAKSHQKSTRYQVEHPGESLSSDGAEEVFVDLMSAAWTRLIDPDFYSTESKRPPSGFLLCGPSGVGKKTVIKHLAATIGVPTVSLAGCFEDPERAERSLTEAFDTATSLAPCILYVEHIDQCMPRPSASSHNDPQHRATRCFARQMARIRSVEGDTKPIFAIATTSNVLEIDPAVLKVGLFESAVQMKIPDSASRRDILGALTRRLSLAQDVNLAEIAGMTHGYVASDLVQILTNAIEQSKVRMTKEQRPFDAMLRLYLQLGKRSSPEDEPDYERCRQYLRGATEMSPLLGPVIMEDFKSAIKQFTPSLRKEGFTVIPDVTWDHVGGLDEARKQLKMSIIGPIKEPDVYRKFGLRRSAGVLLWGPPGCGKTLVAQAVANEAQASLILINGPELLNKYVGESERAIRELFQRARSSTPCILFFDEIDSLVPPRGSTSTDSAARVVDALLTELDGAQDRSGIYVIGTTNRPDLIDEAMLRPGRLSVQLLVNLPTPAERVDILRAIYRTCHDEAADDALEPLAAVALDRRCANFSGADLSGLHTKAAEGALQKWMEAGGEGPHVIAEADWEYALANTRASIKDPAFYQRRSS
ncbi:hypothetical protein CDD83_6221 [Cordyceps sp. RAO-2017]|nr:hypothetical protein CDD83_6221 [Cordyceps sp. RAO-2017]